MSGTRIAMLFGTVEFSVGCDLNTLLYPSFRQLCCQWVYCTRGQTSTQDHCKCDSKVVGLGRLQP